jgi:nucleoside-diphosphate-sugar epimerase
MTGSRTVLVLGASGFLGRHAAAALRARGWRVVPVSRRSRVSLDAAGCSTAGLRALLASWNPDAVVNAVGLLWGGRLDPAALAAVNAEFPARLAAACRGRRLVHLGSVYEYGDHSRVDESTVEEPGTPYARTKLAGSRAVLDAGGTVLRVTTAIGAGMPRDSFLGGLAARLTAGVLDVPLAPGRRDFVHAADVGAAVHAAVSAPATGLFNVGGGRGVPPRHLVELLVRASGVPVTLAAVPAASAVRGGAADQAVSIAAARAGLGWRPRRTLDDAVRELWEARK